MSKSQDLIQPRVTTYLKSTWYARWGIIAIVAASFWFVARAQEPIIGGFLVTAAIFNILLLAGNKRGFGFLANRSLILVIDSALAILLVMLTGADASPYLLVLVFMIISGAYWYGAWAAALIGAVQTALLLTQNIIVNHAQLTFPRNLVIRMMILMVIGLYVALLTRSERSERHQLIELGSETERERQQLLALINNMRDAVLVVDNGGNIIIYNQMASALSATPELNGRQINQSIHFVDTNGQPAELKIGNADSAFERKDLQLTAPDNSVVTVSINVAPYIVDRQNRGHVLIIHDISQEKTVDQERKEFIAVASHELRTPLTIAQGDISLLLSPPYMPQNQEAVGMLNGALRSLQQLSHIIKDLTNLSQVESEELDVDLEPLNPVALLDEFKVDYTDQAKTKGLNLEVKVDPSLNSSTILTSRYVVREIVSIFVSNAIKFTDKGMVTLSVMNPENNAQGVTFRVSDTGIGISQSDQKKIFEKFFQSEDYQTRVHGGTGLGLYIAKQLSARVTARLWFETELGKGSSFYLWVPPYSKHKQDSGKVAAAETKDFFDTV
ncbi:MAG TPA: ATP-binding protein [Candidatus Dormibacteraeota bacterium]|nr:ATP-binding protein [Candidatus Dormibacteraeota bacterium]